MLDLDPYGDSGPLCMFPLFLKRTADVLAPRLSVVFQRLIRLGNFRACWKQVNVTSIPKGPPSTSVVNYWPISITSVSSKMFERQVSVIIDHTLCCIRQCFIIGNETVPCLILISMRRFNKTQNSKLIRHMVQRLLNIWLLTYHQKIQPPIFPLKTSKSKSSSWSLIVYLT